MVKILSIIFSVVVLSIIIFFVVSFVFSAKDLIIVNSENQAASIGEQIAKKEPEKTEITLLAVGDIMLDRGVEYKVYKEGNGDFKFPFLKIADDFKKADIVFGNLESVISDKGRMVGSEYSFRASPKAIEGLVFSGFDIVSIANNHAFDYTTQALQDSINRLKEAGIGYIGSGANENEAFSLKIIESKSTKIGFLAYINLGPKSWRATENNPGIAWIEDKDMEKVVSDIKKAKEKVDILVVSFHWGDEYMENPNNSQEFWAKAIIGAGADLIIGHHPHVVQPLEKIDNGWVAYSLGNFIFDQSFSEETMTGKVLQVKIEDKRIKEVIQKTIKISESFQPYFSSE